MHIPDGFLSTRVWGVMDAVSLPGIVVLARRAQNSFEHHKIPLMGVMGAFIFAAQMINFPVGNGTSGHLVGGALLSFTLGPAAAAIVMTAILATQALVFQDGGLLALGANVFNMAIMGVLAGYVPYYLLRGSRAGVFLGGFLSLLVSALLALGELRVSGVPMPRGIVAVSIGLFIVSAVIEGLITTLVVQALRTSEVAGSGDASTLGMLRRPAEPRSALLMPIMAASILLAAVGILFASTHPDGIQKLAGQLGISGRVQSLLPSPLADYTIHVSWISGAGEWFNRALAGLAGLTVVYFLCALAARCLLTSRPVLDVMKEN